MFRASPSTLGVNRRYGTACSSGWAAGSAGILFRDLRKATPTSSRGTSVTQLRRPRQSFRQGRPDYMEQRRPRLRWFVVWVAAVLGRLSYLQLICYGEYFTKAQHQQQRVFEISPKRGVIYDRKGRELAISLPMDSVFGDPAEITDAEMAARLLAPALAISAYNLETKNRKARSPVRLAKKLP